MTTFSFALTLLPNATWASWILFTVGLLVLAGILVVGVVLGVWLWRRRRTPPAPPSLASPTQPATQVTRGCPRCGTTLPPSAPQGLCPRCVLEVGLGTQTEAGEPGASAGRQPPPPPAEIAQHFPQLEILECLGRGGMGMVYKARQPKLNRMVALKILAPEKGADPRFTERFLREAQALARLDHPNIVTVHDFGEVNGLYFLLMEFVDGLTLRQLLREGRMQPEEALAIVPRICDALQFAHGKGVVHRDIKPENVLVDRDGRVKIADFGIAKMVGAETGRANLTGDRQVIGTPHYMAPEQVENPQRVDHRADIFSLGVVFYELLTGELPLGKFQPPSRRVHVDVRLDDVVLRALEKEPERRYQQAGEVRTAVETITNAGPAQYRPALDASEPVSAKMLRWQRWAWPAGLAVFLLIFLASAVVTALLPRSYMSEVELLIVNQSANQSSVRNYGAIDPYFIQTEMARIQSQEVLQDVIKRLKLDESWAKLYGRGRALAPYETIGILRPRLELRHVQGTRTMRIQVHGEDRNEAAEIANAIADSYLAQASSASWAKLSRAVSAVRASRPNVFLNLAVGAGLGLLAGLITGGLMALIGSWPPRRGVVEPRSSHASLALGLFLGGTLGALLLMALTPRHDAVLLFAAAALLSSLVFGILSWSERTGRLVVTAIVILVAGLGLTVAVLTGAIGLFGAHRAQEAAAQAERARAVAALEEAKARFRPQAVTPAFGPIMECVIPDFEIEPPRVLHLLTGTLTVVPPEILNARSKEALTAWTTTNRVLALVNEGGDTRALGCHGWKFGDLPESAWDEPAQTALRTALEAGTKVLQPREVHAGSTALEIPLIVALPFTLAFETSMGDQGLMQVTEITRNPRTIKIRYRLQQPSGQRGVTQPAARLSAAVARVPDPFVVFGRVTDDQGAPLAGIEVRAACGMGSLMPTGRTHSDADGRYRLSFGPGFRTRITPETPHGVGFQVATITAAGPGWFETNLCRHGNLAMSDEPTPRSEGTNFVAVVRRLEPYALDFVMGRAATLTGTLKDEQGKPAAGRDLWLGGKELPPSCSVLASTKADGEGRFRFGDVPVGRNWWFIAPAEAGGREVRSGEFVPGSSTDLEFQVTITPESLRIEP